MTQQKWRGIKTKSDAINEDSPRTIINRLGQKSISLPRITDDKRWAGFPGLAGAARKIAKVIPECKYYVEPLAGTAKVYQELLKLTTQKSLHDVLNDKSKFISIWLEKEFPSNYDRTITSEDFVDCIKRWDGPDSFYLIDQPWHESYYNQQFSHFDRDSVKDYDNEILELCKDIQGKFIITTRKENKRMLESGFYNTLVRSEYVVSGKYPQVLLTSNFKIDGRKLR